jgi:hypothetical protein
LPYVHIHHGRRPAFKALPITAQQLVRLVVPPAELLAVDGCPHAPVANLIAWFLGSISVY